MPFDYEITIHLLNTNEAERDKIFDEVADYVYDVTNKSSTDVLLTGGPPKED